MIEYQKYTLMTLNDFRRKYYPIATEWEEKDKDKSPIRMSIQKNGRILRWVISKNMKTMMGRSYYFKEYKDCNYTHRSIPELWACHKEWFVDYYTFLNESDFLL